MPIQADIEKALYQSSNSSWCETIGFLWALLVRTENRTIYTQYTPNEGGLKTVSDYIPPWFII
ncbi:hypothetical protein [Clostridium facile]|uniref:Uncharacterized protein n=1 Tax=Clostridium facile TaxID=2763035 RepID=A0ABR7IPB6_9CLOT|nr:hypothetical protein [Clostridium facile]MBC5786962.1 hypothetical protein [Clostridium facile]